VEVLGPRLVALRFRPQFVNAALEFIPDVPHVQVERTPDKVWAFGAVAFTYRVPVPDFVEKAEPLQFDFIAAIANHAASKQTEPASAQPPTAGGKVRIGLAGVDTGAAKPAPLSTTSASPLSGLAEAPAEGYGYLTRVSVPGRPMPEIAVHFEATDGITIFSEGAGRHGFDPTLLVHTAREVDQPTGWATEEQTGRPLPPLKPLFDFPLRDTCICLGADGTYYLTGTTGYPDWGMVTENIQVWKSKDLQEWIPVVTKPRLRSVVWNVDRDGTWQKKINMVNGAPFRPVWAPEIHYLKGTFWIPYCLPLLGTGLLKSTSGQAEGPYLSVIQPDKPLTDRIDASMFQDDDGTVYFVYAGGRVARMKDDMSGLAEEPKLIVPANGPYVGFEGAFLFKANGRYHLAAADFAFGDYECYVASSDKIYGPYGDRYVALPHGGHNMFFQDKDKNWWSAFFGNDVHAPFTERPGAFRAAFGADGRIRPLV
jgi:hypothetical protein